ncbi:SulP family inorganic anion transporter [Pelomicrobium methylotrophicum]|uniref:SulP family inorganic anion transporter n=1 Tax=Pelomicrobium methylotrophicum TaxID=2602750 RepID=UPI001969E812|nr:SulP family inorganic anion transporter [Pelomicrobium methylotrophicum]
MRAAIHTWLFSVFPFLRWWPLVTRDTLRADLTAGLTAAIVVLPQGVAFATLAGMPPEYGLYAAMVPAVVAALFGSSWHLISGPTNAISLVVFATMSPLAEPGSPEYIKLVLTLTFLTGAIQLVMGVARMGTLVNFISHTVVIGFTAGAALLIIASQIKNFFGVSIARGSSFVETFTQFAAQIDDINPYVLAVSVVTLASGILSRRFYPKVPYMIVAMVIGSLFALGLNGWFDPAVTGIATVGALPGGLPPLSAPDLRLETIRTTAPIAFAVAMLALTEAVSIARSIAVKSEQRIDGNQEFIGQGLSNIVGSFFSAYASSGSFNRSGLNYEAGAKTPLSAVFSAFFLVFILLAVAPLAAYLPIPSMAAILFLVGWGLIDFHHIRGILRTSRSETAVLAVTFFGTLLLDLEFAIYAGIIISLLLYLNRTSKPLVLDVKPDPAEGSYHFSAETGLPDCPQLKMVRINGSLFFGAVNHVQQALQEIDERNPQQKHVLIVASGINFVDVAGAEMLAQEARRLRRKGGGLYFYRMKNAVRALMEKGGYLHEIGEENVFPVKSHPVSHIYRRLNPEICRHCRVRIFRECQDRLPNGEPRSAANAAGASPMNT